MTRQTLCKFSANFAFNTATYERTNRYKTQNVVKNLAQCHFCRSVFNRSHPRKISLWVNEFSASVDSCSLLTRTCFVSADELLMGGWKMWYINPYEINPSLKMSLTPRKPFPCWVGAQKVYLQAHVCSCKVIIFDKTKQEEESLTCLLDHRWSLLLCLHKMWPCVKVNATIQCGKVSHENRSSHSNAQSIYLGQIFVPSQIQHWGIRN